MSDRKIAKELETTAQPYPYNADQIAWLHDLETTKEPQIPGFLHLIGTVEGEIGFFCCLGRACVILGMSRTRVGNTVYYDGMDTTLTDQSVKRLRLRGTDGNFDQPFNDGPNEYHNLVELNDNAGWSFKEIAAYIRANPWNVFYA